VKRIYVSGGVLYIEGTRAQIEQLKNICFAALNSSDKRGTNVRLVDPQLGEMVLGSTKIEVKIID